MATTVKEQVEGLDANQKNIYGTVLAVGLGIVAFVTLLVQVIDRDILDNKPFVVSMMVLLGLSLVGLIVVQIMDMANKSGRERQKSTHWHENRMAEGERRGALDLALVQEGKLDGFFKPAGEVEIDGKLVKLYQRK